MKSAFKLFLLQTFILFSFLFVSCATISNSSKSIAIDEIEKTPVTSAYFSNKWQNVASGVNRIDICHKKEKWLATILRIDLKKSGLKPEIYMNEIDGDGKTHPVSVKNAAKKTNAVAAINGVPFSSGFKPNIFSKVSPLGLVYYDETIFSKPLQRYGAAVFLKTDEGYRCTLIDSQKKIVSFLENEEEKAVCAIGGYWVVLDNGKTEEFKKIYDYRSVIGTAENGSVVYLSFVKNGNFNGSASILEFFGAESVLQFDGGSSSSLVIDGKSVFKKKFNHPVCAVLCFVKD